MIVATNAPIADQVRRPGGLGSGEREHQQRQSGGHGQRAGNVEPPAFAARRLGEHARGGERSRRAQRDVDEEHRRPPERLDEHAAQHPPRGAAAGRRGRPPADRAPARRRRIERGGEERERGGRERGGSHALDRARRHQRHRTGRERTGERRDPEHREPGREQPPLAEQVACPARHDQQAAEGERVRAQDPLQAGRGEPERPLDLGQGDRHDRHVEHHQELGGAQHGERYLRSLHSR